MFRQKIVSVVPWYNPDQFHKVYKALYSSDVTSKRWAVDQISVWDTRCHPALPTGIEASVFLARAIIQDILLGNTASLCQEQDICMIYSMALVRFINLMVETNQNAKEKLTLQKVTKYLNIPTWVLDVRNEATHSHAPSLPVLRAGAETALQYLDDNFWKVEDRRIQSVVREEEEEELRLFELITSFKEYKYKELREEIECTNEIKHTISKITDYMKDNRQRFVEILTYPGLFVFTEEELQHVLNPGHSFLEKEDCCELPDILEYFWDQILFLMVKHGLIGDLVELLLLTQDQREPLCQKLVIAWVLRIFQAVDFETPATSILLTYFKSKGVFFNWRRILYATVKHPCRFTPILFAQVLAHLDLKEKWLTQLGHLLAIYQGHGLDQEANGFEKVFTVQDAKRSKKAQNIRKQRSARVQSLWSQAPDNIDFANLPIGAILNPIEERKGEEDTPIEDIFERYIICDPEETKVENETENGKVSDSEEESITTYDDDAEFVSEDNVTADMVYKKKPSNK